MNFNNFEKEFLKLSELDCLACCDKKGVERDLYWLLLKIGFTDDPLNLYNMIIRNIHIEASNKDHEERLREATRIFWSEREDTTGPNILFNVTRKCFLFNNCDYSIDLFLSVMKKIIQQKDTFQKVNRQIIKLNSLIRKSRYQDNEETIALEENINQEIKKILSNKSMHYIENS